MNAVCYMETTTFVVGIGIHWPISRTFAHITLSWFIAHANTAPPWIFEFFIASLHKAINICILTCVFQLIWSTIMRLFMLTIHISNYFFTPPSTPAYSARSYCAHACGRLIWPSERAWNFTIFMLKSNHYYTRKRKEWTSCSNEYEFHYPFLLDQLTHPK